MSDSTNHVPSALDPRRNPSYPARVHWNERVELRGTLETWRAKVAEAGDRLAALPADRDRAACAYLYAQMLGGLDQVADCVRRMPSEAGDLHHEDKHRLVQAVAALERVFAKWAAAA